MSCTKTVVRYLHRSNTIALLLACSIVGCQEVPSIQGSPHRLSAPTNQVLVVGNRASAVAATVSWLQSRSVMLFEMPGTWPLPTHPEITDMARKLQAQTIVWVEQTGDLRAPTVTVRGVDLDSNLVLWSGQASATKYRASPIGARITWLTCHALHAAWGEQLEGDRCG